jgi:glycosyltransferase involved in cell wall biosynthesis
LLGDGHLLLIIGDGPRRESLEGTAVESAPGLVEFRGLMPPAQAARHLRAADVLLVSEVQEMTISSKLYDYCAVGRPLVAATAGEMRRVVEDERIALRVPPGDAPALADAVRRIRADPALGEGLARRARAFAAEHVREEQASRVAELAERVAA